MKRTILACVAALMLTSAAFADTLEDARNAVAKGLEAYKANDFAGAADQFQIAVDLRPDHPRYALNLAAASAKAGRADKAVAALNAYARMGLTAPIEGDEDFASLKGNAGFTAALAKLADNAKPIGQVELRFSLPAEPFLAEGIAFDILEGRLFVSSIRQAKVVVSPRDGGTISDFIPPGKILGGYGMEVDQLRGWLWVVNNASPQVETVTAPAKRNDSAITAVSMTDGSVVYNAPLPSTDDTKATHVIGDLTTTGQGDIYATDSIAPNLYRIAGGDPAGGPSQTIETITNPAFHSLQGITVSILSERLVIADYSVGLHVMDLNTKAITTLKAPPGTTLLGIDGLVRFGASNTLIAVQNGVSPYRILLINLNKDWSAIESVEVVAANLPEMGEPTLGVIAGNDFHFIGYSQWDRFGDDGAIKGSEPMAAPKVYTLRLQSPPPIPLEELR